MLNTIQRNGKSVIGVVAVFIVGALGVLLCNSAGDPRTALMIGVMTFGLAPAVGVALRQPQPSLPTQA